MAVLSLGRDWILAIIFSSVLLLVIYFKPEPGVFVDLFLKGLFLLAVLTLIVHIISKWVERWRSVGRSRSSLVAQADSTTSQEVDSDSYSGDEHDTLDPAVQEQQQQARQRIQEEHWSKAAEYHERVVRPKEEAKRKKEEEDFYRFMGPAWKGAAQKLGADGEQQPGSCRQRLMQGTSREAAQTRQLPEQAQKQSKPVTVPKPREKKRIVLPEEPRAGAPDTVTVILRTPLGTTHKRRITINDSVQILLDFMQTVGYSQRIYQISTSYPRRCISVDPQATLQSLDITKDMALNVEEKE